VVTCGEHGKRRETRPLAASSANQTCKTMRDNGMPVLSSSQARLFNTWHFGYSRVVAVGGLHVGIHKWAQGFMTGLTRIFVGRISPGNVSWLMRSLRRPISGDAR